MDSEYICSQGLTWNNKKEYIWSGFMGFCGCYDETLYNLFFRTLDLLYFAKNKEPFYYDGTLEQELILHCLDSKDLIEHGTAIRSSWLTGKGVEFYENFLKPDDATVKS